MGVLDENDFNTALAQAGKWPIDVSDLKPPSDDSGMSGRLDMRQPGSALGFFMLYHVVLGLGACSLPGHAAFAGSHFQDAMLRISAAMLAPSEFAALACAILSAVVVHVQGEKSFARRALMKLADLMLQQVDCSSTQSRMHIIAQAYVMALEREALAVQGPAHRRLCPRLPSRLTGPEGHGGDPVRRQCYLIVFVVLEALAACAGRPSDSKVGGQYSPISSNSSVTQTPSSDRGDPFTTVPPIPAAHVAREVIAAAHECRIALSSSSAHGSLAASNTGGEAAGTTLAAEARNNGIMLMLDLAECIARVAGGYKLTAELVSWTCRRLHGLPMAHSRPAVLACKLIDAVAAAGLARVMDGVVLQESAGHHAAAPHLSAADKLAVQRQLVDLLQLSGLFVTRGPDLSAASKQVAEGIASAAAAVAQSGRSLEQKGQGGSAPASSAALEPPSLSFTAAPWVEAAAAGAKAWQRMEGQLQAWATAAGIAQPAAESILAASSHSHSKQATHGRGHGTGAQRKAAPAPHPVPAMAAPPATTSAAPPALSLALPLPSAAVRGRSSHSVPTSPVGSHIIPALLDLDAAATQPTGAGTAARSSVGGAWGQGGFMQAPGTPVMSSLLGGALSVPMGWPGMAGTGTGMEMGMGGEAGPMGGLTMSLDFLDFLAPL